MRVALLISANKKYLILAVLAAILIIFSSAGWFVKNSLEKWSPLAPNSNRLINLLAPKLTSVELNFAIPEYKATATMKDKNWLTNFEKLLAGSDKVAGTISPQEEFWQILLNYEEQESRLLLATRDLQVFDPINDLWLINDELSNLLNSVAAKLEKSFFGVPTKWEEVTNLFPRKTKATVRDLETGITFEVFRYGGTYHADVEPVTLSDTEKLKLIFDGGWSWKRRAVILTVGDRQIAASMNGTPHGGGDIMNNQFKGHFCIHFSGSRIHKTTRVDQSHQLMISKASGQNWDVLRSAEPEEFVAILLTAVANGDSVTARYAFGLEELESTDLWSRLVAEIRFIQIKEISEMQISQGQAQVEATLTVYFYEPGEPGYDKKMLLNLVRPVPEDGWVAHLADLDPLVEKIAAEEVKTINVVELIECE